MSILFVLLTFLLILTVSYVYRREGATEVVARPSRSAIPKAPRIERQYGFEVPRGYCFHPGHTWVLDEGRQMARVGIDNLATTLLGKIERIEVVGLNRWVRQGQKLMSVTQDGSSVDLLSPIEGVVTSVNPSALREPASIAADPYKDGWICVIKAPDMTTNLKNLMQGPMVGSWMQNSVARLNAMAAAEGATAQDGGVPVSGMLAHVSSDLRQRIVKEFFMS
jgi:glycine cleavage system H lipoate-binding protein